MVILLSLCLFSSFADSLYDEGDYARAIIEYKRMLFAQITDTPRAFYRIGMSYKRSGRHWDSLHSLKQAFETTLPESLEEEFSLEIADSYLRTLQYPLARLELEGIENPEAKRLCAISHLLAGEFGEASKVLDERIDPKGDLRAVATEGEKMGLLNANLMAISSALLPGSGQVLSGDVKDGLLSFLLTVSTGFLVYDAYKDRRYLDASLIFGQLFWRFYTGSIRNAYKSAEEENLKRKRMVLLSSKTVREYLE